MPRPNYTVDDLIDNVRSQIDEQNIDAVDDVADILPALNRAQDFAFNILSRQYEEPLLRTAVVDIVGGQRDYTIPEDAFEDRLEKIEISFGGDRYEVKRISYRDISDYETSTRVNIPQYYAIIGRKFRLLPTPTGTYDARIWYLAQPEKLVKPQGRVTKVDAVNNALILDSIGDDITTETDELNSYINVIDGHTGVVKGSFQVKITDGQKLTIKTTPTRTSVLGKTILTSLEDLPDPQAIDAGVSTLSVDPDDYISTIHGTCIPYFPQPTTNFLIQYAVAELQRKLGGDAGLEERVLEKFEKQVERSWVGREQTLRVQKRSKNWDRYRRRWPYNQ